MYNLIQLDVYLPNQIQQQHNNTMENNNTTINFYEGCYLFNSIETKLRVQPDFIEYTLAKQYEYRPTTESLWATISQNGKEISRYELKFGEGLNKI